MNELLPSSWVMRAVIAGAIKVDLYNQADIGQTGTDALVDALHALGIGGDYRGHAHIITVIEQLEELLIGPGRALL